ncbi:hypothetical protein [Desulfotalea psychrophila]|nr:hypothetical protein [Desulfotalea psychrophila]
MFRKSFLRLLLTLFCIIPVGAVAGESATISGAWLANGYQQIFVSAPIKLYQFDLSGHVSMTQGIAGELDFWSQCVGIGTSPEDIEARCLWQDLDGGSIILQLRGQSLQEGVEVAGNIVGGAGKYAGITGTVAFTWSALSFGREEGRTVLTGHTTNLGGEYTIP